MKTAFVGKEQKDESTKEQVINGEFSLHDPGVYAESAEVLGDVFGQQRIRKTLCTWP